MPRKPKEKPVNDWMIWMALAGGAVIVEMFTGTFYLLMLAIGLAAGGLAAVSGANTPMQFLIASLIGVVATYMLRRSRIGNTSHIDAARDPNINLDIGQTMTVSAWQSSGSDTYIARALYRGALWDVELQNGAVARPGQFIIREVKGSRLIVSNA
jgi:membrane protein implicated in regulation of membrane protease activity